MSKISEFIEATLLEKREALLVERNKACAPWDTKIAEIDAFLRQSRMGADLDHNKPKTELGKTTLVENILTARKANRMALEAAELVLKEYSQMKTGELWQLVQERGVQLIAANQEERFGQLLSGAKDIFQSDRRLGWSLKSEAPLGATNTDGASSATESDGS
ncbi:MAG: hypothetical protein U1D36_16000 [Hydrogenophaga sp.]|uniref:hypothetical protein n=1 Tax=Hydrogenophaga sp. TaxID=1904254 RepID=UPI00275DA609|nr:hypothetical protein [Hydrogenophaga sp.]MDP2416018.1 hypothetical protein [Hydrogenophaga sp.]MDZ4175957.1 hypothetical protein [Hydrogenophaga sp.]